MNIWESDEYKKEYKALSKKYLSLPSDIEHVKALLLECPLGKTQEGVRLFRADPVKRDDETEQYICKIRVRCQSLKNANKLRLLYYFNGQSLTLCFVELYTKGHKEHEDYKRINNVWDQAQQGTLLPPDKH